MRIERRNTTQGQSPYAGIDFRLTTSEIRNPDGSVVFRLDNVEVPEFWSQVASDVLAQKYFRKAGVPAAPEAVEEDERAVVPVALGARRARRWPACPRPSAMSARLSAKQVFDRLAGCWTYWGWKGGYFTSEDDAQAFYDELRFMLATADGARRTRRSGSTPACTGPTASTARRRAITTSIPTPAS